MRTFIAFLFLTAIVSASTLKSNLGRNYLYDNSIETVQIGEQIWMLKNLDVDTFQNGDKIIEAASWNDWIKASKEGVPTWCYFNNDSCMGKRFGKLYNWYAVIDKRGLAPERFRIPTRGDFLKLYAYVKEGTRTELEADSKLADERYWKWGNNSSGFSILPAGERFGEYPGYRGGFSIPPDTLNRFLQDIETGFWISELCSYQEEYIWAFLPFNEPGTQVYGVSKSEGLPVRCIKIEQ